MSSLGPKTDSSKNAKVEIFVNNDKRLVDIGGFEGAEVKWQKVQAQTKPFLSLAIFILKCKNWINCQIYNKTVLQRTIYNMLGDQQYCMVWSTLLSHTLAIMATAESKELGRCSLLNYGKITQNLKTKH